MCALVSGTSIRSWADPGMTEDGLCVRGLGSLQPCCQFARPACTVADTEELDLKCILRQNEGYLVVVTGVPASGSA
jgi:hypothetical protein